MDLIVNQMVQLQVVGITNSDKVVEGFAGTSVIQNSLSILTQTSKLQCLADILLISAVKDGSGNLPAQSLCSIPR